MSYLNAPLTTSRIFKVSVIICLIGMWVPFPIAVYADEVLWSLLIPASPLADAAGGCNSLNFHTDPMTILTNPASLGLQAMRYQVSAAFSPQKSAWRSYYSDQIPYEAQIYTAGLDLKHFFNAPFAMGLSYGHLYFDWGEQILTDATKPRELGRFHAFEKVHCLSIALAFKYYVDFSFGYTYKIIALQDVIKDKGLAVDWGVIAQLPVLDLLAKKYPALGLVAGRFQPRLDLGTFYSCTDHPIDFEESNHRAHFGINLHLGLKYRSLPFIRELFGLSWAREGESRISPDFEFNFPKISDKQGWQFEAGECFYLRRGQYYDWKQTKGWGINCMQPIRWLHGSGVVKLNHWAWRALLRLDVEYHSCDYKIMPFQAFDGTQFRSLVIRFSQP